MKTKIAYYFDIGVFHIRILTMHGIKRVMHDIRNRKARVVSLWIGSYNATEDLYTVIYFIGFAAMLAFAYGMVD